MECLYFNADLKGLINELNKYASYDDIIKFILNIDFINTHIKDKNPSKKEQEILADILVNNSEKSVHVNSIKKVVGKHFSIKMEDFNSKRKTQSIAWPRQIAMFLTNELTDLSLPEIGREFNRDHSTVVHARDLVKEKINTDPFFTAEINQIITEIKAVDNK